MVLPTVRARMNGLICSDPWFLQHQHIVKNGNKVEVEIVSSNIIFQKHQAQLKTKRSLVLSFLFRMEQT